MTAVTSSPTAAKSPRSRRPTSDRERDAREAADDRRADPRQREGQVQPADVGLEAAVGESRRQRQHGGGVGAGGLEDDEAEVGDPRDAELLAEAEAGDRVDAGVDEQRGDVVGHRSPLARSCAPSRPVGRNGEHREQDHEGDHVLVVGHDERGADLGAQADHQRAEHRAVRLARAAEEHRGQDQDQEQVGAGRAERARVHREDGAGQAAQRAGDQPGDRHDAVGADPELRARLRLAAVARIALPSRV